MRRPIIIGNWKMNKTSSEAVELINGLKPLVKKAKPEVVVCVPFTDFCAVKPLIDGTNIKLGAQNVAWADKGAFTGEISADMLLEKGVEYVIIGHSERRTYFGDTNESVNKRAKQALNKGLKPIICVGESLEDRQKNRYKRFLKKQLLESLDGIDNLSNVIIAYEPIWAIGTGVVATNEDANEAIGYLRRIIKAKYGADTAKALRIQYGGSMNASNAKGLMSMRHIDGGLIGGAS